MRDGALEDGSRRSPPRVQADRLRAQRAMACTGAGAALAGEHRRPLASRSVVPSGSTIAAAMRLVLPTKSATNRSAGRS